MSDATPADVSADALRKRAFDIIRERSFRREAVTLASGQVSDHYFDMKPSMLCADGIDCLARLILARMDGLDVDYVGGIEMGAVPLIGPIAMLTHGATKPIDGFFVRKQQKQHGTQKLIEGVASLAGASVVIVEDVTTTGGSAVKAIDAVKAAGAEIALVISILDREASADAVFRDAGLPFASLFKASEFLRG